LANLLQAALRGPNAPFIQMNAAWARAEAPPQAMGRRLVGKGRKLAVEELLAARTPFTYRRIPPLPVTHATWHHSLDVRMADWFSCTPEETRESIAAVMVGLPEEFLMYIRLSCAP